MLVASFVLHRRLKVEIRRSMLRVQLYSFLVAYDSLVPFLGAVVGPSEIVVGVGIVRIQFDCLFVAVYGLAETVAVEVLVACFVVYLCCL